jgi:hypothetical protein
MGALVGRRAGSAVAGIKWLGAGAVVGALVGAGIWMIVLWRTGRRPPPEAGA